MGGPGASVLLRKALTKQQEEELELWLRSITNHLEKNRSGFEFWLNEDAFPGTVSRCLFYFSLDDTTGESRWNDEKKKQVRELLGYLPEQSIGIASGCNQSEDHTTLGQFILHLAGAYNGLIDMEGAIAPPLRPVGQAEMEKLKALLATAPERQKAKQAYLQARLETLKASLPPGKTMLDLIQEQSTDPNSPLKPIMDDVEAKFGSTFPPELSTSARMASLEEISSYVATMPGTIYGIEYITANGRRWVSHIVDREFLQAWMNHPNFYMVK